MKNDIPVRKMRAYIMEAAIDQLEDDRPCKEAVRARLYAALWLGSKAGRIWWENIDADYVAVLEAIEWRRHAAEVLESDTWIYNRYREALQISIGTLFMIGDSRYG